MTPICLRCEYLHDPPDIDAPAPLLTSRTLCRWHVRVWDEAGQPGNWSKPAVFEMGLLAATDWRTSWIGRPEHDTGKHIFTSQE
jgi:hypothetical protein